MKKINIIFITAVAVLLFSFPAATLMSDSVNWSVFENRTLEPTPVLSAKTVFDGSFFTSTENWLKDHIAGRDKLLTGYTAFLKYVFNKPNVNDVIDTGTSLLPYIPPQQVSLDDIQTEAEYLSKISEKTNFLYLGVPSQASMFADEYPSYLKYIADSNLETSRLFKTELDKCGVDFKDCKDILTKDMYFSTDHHFDITGGYAVYEAICEYAGVNAVPWSDFSVKEYETDIYGSRNRKIYKLTSLSDKISYCEQNTHIPFTRFDDGVQVESKVFELPEENDVPSYSIYMGGDVAETVIKTDRAELPDILVYGDSYTNAVECFAYLSFNETRYLDLRYYDKMSLEEYIDRYKPDYVFCIRDDGKYADLTGNGLGK